ncbi:hypothetical protein N9D31_03350 [Oligoflexaceae bacterium]|nr:hypothetical protein [Oligoflexaceae bacterium]
MVLVAAVVASWYQSTIVWFAIFIVGAVTVFLDNKNKQISFSILYLLAGVFYYFACFRLSLEFNELHGHISMKSSDIAGVSLSKAESLTVLLSFLTVSFLLVNSRVFRKASFDCEKCLSALLVEVMIIVNLFSLSLGYLFKWQVGGLVELRAAVELIALSIGLVLFYYIYQAILGKGVAFKKESQKSRLLLVIVVTFFLYCLTRESTIEISSRLLELKAANG